MEKYVTSTLRKANVSHLHGLYSSDIYVECATRNIPDCGMLRVINSESCSC